MSSMDYEFGFNVVEFERTLDEGYPDYYERISNLPDGDAASAPYDAERESYASLADEMNDPEAPAWVEADWDEQAVAEGKSYAAKHDLPWPPGPGDFDRWYEEQR